MTSISINQFTNNLQGFVKQVIQQHIPLKITNQDGADFVVISAEDWEQQQETLFVLQNSPRYRWQTTFLRWLHCCCCCLFETNLTLHLL